MQHYDSDIHADQPWATCGLLQNGSLFVSKIWPFLTAVKISKNRAVCFFEKKSCTPQIFLMKYTFDVFHIHVYRQCIIQNCSEAAILDSFLWSEMWQ